MHILKHKGDIGVAATIAELTEQGFVISIPISEHAKYDLIAEKDGQPKRIQVRYAKTVDGVINVKLKSTWADKKGNHIANRIQGDYDYLSVYCPDTKECYFVPDEKFDNGTMISLRLSASKNNRKSRLAKDYRKLKV